MFQFNKSQCAQKHGSQRSREAAGKSGHGGAEAAEGTMTGKGCKAGLGI